MTVSNLTTYYRLTKPGIIRGNAITAGAGFLLAAHGHINMVQFAAMLIGLSLVIASACVFNNFIDRDIDKLMTRTQARALVVGELSAAQALLFGATLGLVGTAILIIGTNLLATGIAVFGWVAYVIVYGYYKRQSVHGTIVGSMSGAVPPVVGYCAVTGKLDAAAVILFLILVLWQMPHFYAIAMYRLDDYRTAKIPVLPAVRGIAVTKLSMLAYIVGFIAAASLLTLFGYTGIIYLTTVSAAGLAWLALGYRGLGNGYDTRWAKQMFGWSLVVILVFSTALSLDSLMP